MLEKAKAEWLKPLESAESMFKRAQEEQRKRQWVSSPKKKEGRFSLLLV
jgi:hypothetical protein